MLTAALIVVAALAGLTGTWSPCGLSMIETLGPTGHRGGRRTTAAACATFALGALAGGVATFAALAALGALAGSGGDATAQAVAAAVALAAALGELRGARIVPQVRRQLPEHWRRVLPMPLAGGLYGVLLGIGFTTFVLTFAVWALAGISVALGDPALGAAIGLAFGSGRALPVVALAPLAGSSAGAWVAEAMTMRPALLRGFRLADGTALAVCAAALVAAPASAATVVSKPATDPVVAGDLLAWSVPGGQGVLVRGASAQQLPGTDPALGGPFVAWRTGDQVTVADAATLAPLLTITVPGVSKLAVSAGWLAWRAPRPGGGDVIAAASLSDPSVQREVASVPAPAQLSRPTLDGDTVAFGVAGARRSRIDAVDLRTGARRTLRRGRDVMVTNPTLSGGALLYVRTSSRTQQLRLAAGGRERTVYRIAATARRDRGYEPGHHPLRRHYREPHRLRKQPRDTTTTLWTTALSVRAAYVTRLTRHRGVTQATVVRVRR